MYCRKDITDKADGFDAVVAASNYAELKALPPFPTGAGSSTSGSVDLKPVLDAIAAGDAQLLTAIGQVDENTLATFGLKRI
jgi:hypothetical protein